MQLRAGARPAVRAAAAMGGRRPRGVAHLADAPGRREPLRRGRWGVSPIWPAL